MYCCNTDKNIECQSSVSPSEITVCFVFSHETQPGSRHPYFCADSKHGLLIFICAGVVTAHLRSVSRCHHCVDSNHDEVICSSSQGWKKSMKCRACGSTAEVIRDSYIKFVLLLHAWHMNLVRDLCCSNIIISQGPINNRATVPPRHLHIEWSWEDLGLLWIQELIFKVREHQLFYKQGRPLKKPNLSELHFWNWSRRPEVTRAVHVSVTAVVEAHQTYGEDTNHWQPYDLLQV